MKALTGLSREPIFCPIVSDFYSGMVVTVPLFADDLIGGAGPEEVRTLYRQTYQGPLVHFTDEGGDGDGFLSAAALSGRDDMEIAVFGNRERILLTARYDNLGKGASGAAVEILNLLLHVDPATGLNL
jgi:N-acetyl-gamma-glutamyl-phosphate reductase